MAGNNDSVITLGKFRYYHSRIMSDFITPIHNILYDNATDNDIASLFENAPSPNTIYFSGIDTSVTPIIIKDSSNNTISYDNSGEIFLENGKTYRITIKKPSQGNYRNDFTLNYTADGSNGIVIANPFFMKNFTLNNGLSNADGLTIDVTGVFGGTRELGKTSLVFNSVQKILIKSIDFSMSYSGYQYDSYNDNRNKWYMKLYGSNDGINYTEIPSQRLCASLGEFTKVIDTQNYDGDIRLRMENNSTGYIYHKLDYCWNNSPSGTAIYGAWITEAYVVD